MQVYFKFLNLFYIILVIYKIDKSFFLKYNFF